MFRFILSLLLYIFCITGYEAMDNNGVFGRRVGLGPDEGGQLRGDAYSCDLERSATGARLPPLREEAT